MADLSLNDLIRRRGLSNGLRGMNISTHRGGVAGGTFDARQKIGTSDVRQRLGGAANVLQVKDAREKIRKDARLQIRGGVVGGSVQDARETINSRKQHGQKQLPEPLQISLQTQSNSNPTKTFLNVSPLLQRLNTKKTVALQQDGGSKKVTDARDRLSLKRSLANDSCPESLSSIKITKTIQQRPVALTSAVHVSGPGRSDKVNNGTNGSPFSSSITKVVQNDSYTAPTSSVPAVPSISPQADHCTVPDLLPVSRTLVMDQALQGDSQDFSSSLVIAKSSISPLQGTKMTVTNLHQRVTEEDIVELFCVCGALKRTRLLRAGVAEVVFVRKEDAVSAYKKYNNRCLDGQPMKCNLHMQGNVITSDQSILLRLSDSPGSIGDGGVTKDGLPPSLSRLARPSSQPSTEVDPQTILKALFKSSLPVLPSSESGGTQATAFCIKI